MQVSSSISSKRPVRRRKLGATSTSAVDPRVTLAMRLDMLAGCELQHGHHLAAEHLARRAQAVREARL